MKALTTKQAETLQIAAYGPLSMVKGVKTQTNALKRKGLLDDNLELTDEGRDAVARLTPGPLYWADLDHALRPRFTDQLAEFVGAVSADGFTAYLARRGNYPAVAIYTRTLPDFIRPFFGLGVER